MTESDSIPFIAPVHYFSLAFDCQYITDKELENTKLNLKKKFLIPETDHLCDEESFADVSMAWNEHGLVFSFIVHEPCQTVYYPDVSYGDSIELMIDTRDNKESGFNHRFCHHFFILPKKPDDGPQAAEITRFRTEDAHEWCNSTKLSVDVKTYSKYYEILFKIPSECLHGYDPQENPRLGFTYRINRFRNYPQHFSVCSREFNIDQQPSLWSSVRLKK